MSEYEGAKLASVRYDEVNALMPKQETVRERLERRKRQHEAQLADVNAALLLLDENPTFEKVHDAIQKAGY